MKTTVYYLMTGPAHNPYLAVSLMTLRRHWAGPVRVFAFEESYKQAKLICEDTQIKAEIIKYDPYYRGKNCQEWNKLSIAGVSWPLGEKLMYVDADTIINGPIDDMFTYLDEYPFIATQFCDWTMNVNAARNRVNRLVGIPGIDQECVKQAMERTEYAYNSGVFSTLSGLGLLRNWKDWTYNAKHIFIAGETCLHPIMKYHADQVLAMPGGRFNASPKYNRLPDNKVAIWHGHGDSFVRPNKSPKGWELFAPLLEEVRLQNIGQINDWLYETPNNFLRELIA